MIFESGQDILVLKLEEEDQKKIQLEKKVKDRFFLVAPLLFLTRNFYNSCFTNQHFVQIIFPCTL